VVTLLVIDLYTLVVCYLLFIIYDISDDCYYDDDMMSDSSINIKQVIVMYK